MGTSTDNEAQPASPHLSHPKYRPDIDGLRAIAVLSVVAFHAFPTWMTGGYIGVDVFFVISGFLISTILFENLAQGTFSLAEFYARRIRRIFPALALVLVATYVIGWNGLLADEYTQLSKHIAGGAGFIANFVLWNESGYFDNAADTKPLLHLWSLGIEEQFYIVWPLLLWLAWKKKFNVLAITVLVLLVSFYLNVSGIDQDRTATFYAPQTRFWELLCGAILAWAKLRRHSVPDTAAAMRNGWFSTAVRWSWYESRATVIANVLSLLGLALLVYGFFSLHRDSEFPGIWAVVPVLGAVLIIAAGAKAWLNRTVLSNRLIVWFGLISFPLYLWHWPLLSFTRILQGKTPDWQVRATIVAVSIVLAWLTYRFVERPVRSRTRGAVPALMVVLLVVGYAGYNAYVRHGLTFRSVVKLNNAIKLGEAGGHGDNVVNDCGIADEALKKLYAFCAQDKRGNVKFALMGDSKAGVLFSGLVRTSSNSGRWLFIGGTGPHGGPNPMISSDPDLRSFQYLTTEAVKAIAGNGQIEKVAVAAAIRSIFQLGDGVKGGNFATYDHTYLKQLSSTPHYNRTLDGLSETISRFVKAGKKVVLIVDNPALPNAQDCLARKVRFFMGDYADKRSSDCWASLSEFNRQIATYRSLLTELEARFPGMVQIFDPTEVYCDKTKGICGPERDGRPLYAVTDHISDYAAGLVGERLNKFMIRDSDGYLSAE